MTRKLTEHQRRESSGIFAKLASSIYYRNRFGEHPRTIRFIRRLENGEIEGVCFGQTYFVKATDYEIAQNRGY